MTEVYRVLEANPWVVQAVLAVGELPPSALRLSERMFAATRVAGLDERTAHAAIWRCTWGHVFFGRLARACEREGSAGRAGCEELAHVMPAMLELETGGIFRGGLEVVVDGFLAR